MYIHICTITYLTISDELDAHTETLKDIHSVWGSVFLLHIFMWANVDINGKIMWTNVDIETKNT